MVIRARNNLLAVLRECDRVDSRSVLMISPVSASYIRIVWSHEPETMRLPSCENVTDWIDDGHPSLKQCTYRTARVDPRVSPEDSHNCLPMVSFACLQMRGLWKLQPMNFLAYCPENMNINLPVMRRIEAKGRFKSLLLIKQFCDRVCDTFS